MEIRRRKRETLIARRGEAIGVKQSGERGPICGHVSGSGGGTEDVGGLQLGFRFFYFSSLILKLVFS